MFKLVAVNSRAVEAVENLQSKGIDVFPIKSSFIDDNSTALHADMLILPLDAHNILIDSSQIELANVIAKYQEVRLLSKNEFVNYLTKGEQEREIENFRGINLIPITHKICSPYPNDVPLNVRFFGKHIICNTEFVAEEIKIYAKFKNYHLIHTNQGYAACSTIHCKNTLITDDISLYKCSVQHQINSVLIDKGSVKLSENHYGFIGGCCGYIDKNTLAFNGELKTHSDYNKIINTLRMNGINYVELTHGDITDIGGIVPIIL